MFTGIHLAGPDLNPEAFRDGFYRFAAGRRDAHDRPGVPG